MRYNEWLVLTVSIKKWNENKITDLVNKWSVYYMSAYGADKYVYLKGMKGIKPK